MNQQDQLLKQLQSRIKNLKCNNNIMWREIVEAVRKIKCKLRCCCMVKSDCIGDADNEQNNNNKSIEI